ncbi:MAG: hypothetical protein Q4C98_03680 [Capnocytophaga sp.]|nr:hypothetical protein [Capnocytophaga sp.]
MKRIVLSIVLGMGLLASCENVAQLVQNVSNEVSESSERIEQEIDKNTDQIKGKIIENINLETITNEILNTKHLDNIENVALKVVEYQNIANRISNMQENLFNGELGVAEVLAITQFTKAAQQELLQLKQKSTSTATTQKIDSLLNNYQRVQNIYSAQNLENRGVENRNEDNEFENENENEDDN